VKKELPEVWTISQLTRRVKKLLEAEVGTLWVAGEISNWKVAGSGHAYFTLKDEGSQIDAVLFRGVLSRLRFEPENGLAVLAQGRVTVYERRGNYQIIIESMQPKGIGALQLAFEKLKKKLAAEGLFNEEHKKPLPLLPRRIGVVTSPTGAAIRDILHVLNRRFANVHVLIYPARVQGDEAAAEIAAGIEALDGCGVDAMIVGRGGGSLEDLWPFNEEIVVRAVYKAETPIISAVGHEVDFALSDFAADLRAPTPSAAAEVVVKERQALSDQAGQLRLRMARAVERRIERVRHRLENARGSVIFRRPEEMVRQRRQESDELRMRLEDAMQTRLREERTRTDGLARSLALLSPSKQWRQAVDRHGALRGRLLHAAAGLPDRVRSRLVPLIGRLDALSPLAILSRGYALAWKLPDRELVRRAGDLKTGDEVELRFGEGGARAAIREIKETAHGAGKENGQF
jgi:exodeoxyribonuclease VII large subunit